MAFQVVVILLGVFSLASSFTNPSTKSCSSTTINCRSGNQCVSLSDICRNGPQCSDNSDEDPRICQFWETNDHCRAGQLYCRTYLSCKNIKEFCSNSNCASDKKQICKLVNQDILYIEEEQSGMVLTEELVSLLQKAVNITSKDPLSCPMFYTRVGAVCVAFFSPAKIPWAEARQFCRSIEGDLISLGASVTHVEILKYMSKAKLTGDYWIGGRYDIDTNSWAWVRDDSAMPLGSPYWATKYSTSCVPRSPATCDPYSSPPEAVPGAPCFNYIQAPTHRAAGWCAALTYEHFYYFSDELCHDNKNPMCILMDKE